MKKTAVLAALLLAAPAAACGQGYGGGADTGGTGEDDGSTRPLDAEVVDFQTDGFAAQRGGALGEDPIDPQEVFGRDGEPPEPAGDDVAYVAVSGLSGCFQATGADIHREGEDLEVKFDIDRPPPPDDDIQCVRSFEPYVQFAVDVDDVEGVTTINGKPPLN